MQMRALTEFYLERVAQCADEAKTSGLANQRTKFLHAEAAWQALANRSARNERVQVERELV
jgi:hypothetical protein